MQILFVILVDHIFVYKEHAYLISFIGNVNMFKTIRQLCYTECKKQRFIDVDNRVGITFSVWAGGETHRQKAVRIIMLSCYRRLRFPPDARYNSKGVIAFL